MNVKLKKSIHLLLLLGLLLGLTLLAVYAWQKTSGATDEHGEHAEHGNATESNDKTDKDDPEKGPHGGRLLRKGDFALEVKIFEDGVEPQLRLYGYDKQQPIDPQKMRADVTIGRLDAQQAIGFKAEADYLLGDQVIYEPHSFDVAVTAQYAQQKYAFTWSQAEGRVQMADAALNSSGLQLLTVGNQAFAASQQISGEIALRPDAQVAVTARSAAVVTQVHVRLGQQVEKGAALATLDSRELMSLRANLRTTQQQMALRQTLLAREERLWRDKISPEQDYLQAKSAYAEAKIRHDEATQLIEGLGAVLANSADGRFVLRAPMRGTVLSTTVAVGQAVTADSSLFQMADLSTILAVVNVPSTQLADFHVGMKAQIRVQSSSESSNAEQGSNLDPVATGVVEYISAQLDPNNRSAVAHIRLQNNDQRWRVGQLIAVEVSNTPRSSLAVREDALQTFRDWTVVFIRVGDQFEVRPVELGERSNGYAEVLSGVQSGQVYAAGNSFLLKAELGKAGASHDH